MSGFVFVVLDAEEEVGGVDLPIEGDGTLLLSVLQSQFREASGLKYRNPSTGRWIAVRLTEGKLYPPIADSSGKNTWGSSPYTVAGLEQRGYSPNPRSSPTPQRKDHSHELHRGRSRESSPAPQRSREPSPAPQRSREPSPAPQRARGRSPLRWFSRSRDPSPDPQRSKESSPVPQGSREPSPAPQGSREPSPAPQRSRDPSPAAQRSREPSPAPQRARGRSPLRWFSRSRDPSPDPQRSREASPGPRRSRESSPGPRRSRESSPGPRRSRESSPGPRRSRESSPGGREPSPGPGPRRSVSAPGGEHAGAQQAGPSGEGRKDLTLSLVHRLGDQLEVIDKDSSPRHRKELISGAMATAQEGAKRLSGSIQDLSQKAEELRRSSEELFGAKTKKQEKRSQEKQARRQCLIL